MNRASLPTSDGHGKSEITVAPDDAPLDMVMEAASDGADPAADGRPWPVEETFVEDPSAPANNQVCDSVCLPPDLLNIPSRGFCSIFRNSVIALNSFWKPGGMISFGAQEISRHVT